VFLQLKLIYYLFFINHRLFLCPSIINQLYHLLAANWPFGISLIKRHKIMCNYDPNPP